MIIDEATYIEHFGMKGMKWGVRNENRQRNKASRAKDWEKQSKKVTAAKKRVNSGAIKKEWKQSKIQFKKDKLTMGSREARKILNAKRVKLNSEYYKSREVRTQKGQIAAIAALVVLGGLQISSARY